MHAFNPPSLTKNFREFLGLIPLPYTSQNFGGKAWLAASVRSRVGLQTSGFFLLLSTICGTFSWSPTAKSSLCLKRDFCLFAFGKKKRKKKKKCVLHIQLNCRISLSLCPAPPSSDKYCNFIRTPVPTHAQWRSTNNLVQNKEEKWQFSRFIFGKTQLGLGSIFYFLARGVIW